jgi:hypothetical protein
VPPDRQCPARTTGTHAPYPDREVISGERDDGCPKVTHEVGESGTTLVAPSGIHRRQPDLAVVG